MAEAGDKATTPRFLRTKYVFIDTQAYRNEGLNWTGGNLAKLLDLASADQIRLLITSITVSEVHERIREMVDDATKALDKFGPIFTQLGGSSAVTALSDKADAYTQLVQTFSNFLTKIRAVYVPLDVEVETVFADYFNRKPPFSLKKKWEFPDAFVIAGLRNWCDAEETQAYIVSNDPDMPKCCDSDGPLICIGKVSELISHALVSRDTNADLLAQLRKNRLLKSELLDLLRDYDLDTRDVETGLRHSEMIDAVVVDVEDLVIFEVNILDINGNSYRCDIEFAATLTADVSFAVTNVAGTVEVARPGSTIIKRWNVPVYRTAQVNLAMAADNTIALVEVEMRDRVASLPLDGFRAAYDVE